MSLLPRKTAPSAITILGARMFPASLPLAWISTRTAAVQSPVTSPLTTMLWASMLALTLPPWATRRSRRKLSATRP